MSTQTDGQIVQQSRFKVEPLNNRFCVIDSDYRILICHTAYKEIAETIAATYNRDHSDAPPPTDEFTNRRLEVAHGV